MIHIHFLSSQREIYGTNKGLFADFIACSLVTQEKENG